MHRAKIAEFWGDFFHAKIIEKMWKNSNFLDFFFDCIQYSHVYKKNLYQHARTNRRKSDDGPDFDFSHQNRVRLSRYERLWNVFQNL